jgi:dolichol-phosphate mannosyltransferase
MTKLNIVCMIPAFNCSQQINRTLERVLVCSDLFSEIWIIDNQSTDQTTTSVLRFISSTKDKRFKLFQNSENVSLGGTLKNAFKMAELSSFTHIAVVHGDDQAEPSDLRLPVSFLRSGEKKGSFFGSRFSRKSRLVGYRIERILGNLLLNSIYSAVTFRKLTDLGSGLNLYEVDQLRKIPYEHMSNAMSFNYELLLGFIGSKQVFEFFPISWREEDQVTNARNFSVFGAGLKIIFAWRFRKIKSKSLENPLFLPKEILS